MTFESFYDAQWLPRAAYFGHHRRRFLQTWDAVDGIALPREAAVFDVGGVGPGAAYLVTRGCVAHGSSVDLRGPLPFPDGAFDLVLCTEVIEHIKDVESQEIRDLEAFNYSGIRNMLRELRRVVKAGGAVLVTTPNASSWHMLAKWLHGELQLADPSHVREFTPSGLEAIARDCGLEPEWIRTVDSWHLGRSDLLDRIEAVIQQTSTLAPVSRRDNIMALFRPG